MRVLTSAQMKLAEKNSVEMGTTYLQLMRNAGLAAADYILKTVGTRISDSKCMVICGSGNNGGDGFVAALQLYGKAKSVTVVLVNSLPKTRDAVTMLEECKNAGIEVLDIDFDLGKVLLELPHTAIIIDAVFGTGFHGDLPQKALPVFEAINSDSAAVFALDLPSGVNSDTGEADKNAIKASYTIAFASAKFGHIIKPGMNYCGMLYVADIGIPEKAYENIDKITISVTEKQVSSLIPERRADSHKGTYGKLLVIAGSRDMSGAAAMSVKSALRSGVGICTLASTEKVISRVASNTLEATFLTLPENENGGISSKAIPILYQKLSNFDAICIGMGMGDCDDTLRISEAVLKYAKCPVIIDADGINALSHCIQLCKDTDARLVLTPHLGEMARLIRKPVSEIKHDKMNVANKFAEDFGVTLVLKDANTIIASPNGKLYINSTGNAGLARGGSGDVLSGIIGAFAAQGLSPLASAITGVFVHGYTADIVADGSSMQGMLPSDLISTLPYTFKRLTSENK